MTGVAVNRPATTEPVRAGLLTGCSLPPVTVTAERVGTMPTGHVTILGITDDAVCLAVDLTWTVDKPADNVLTMRGVFAGRLLDRSTLYILGSLRARCGTNDTSVHSGGDQTLLTNRGSQGRAFLPQRAERWLANASRYARRSVSSAWRFNRARCHAQAVPTSAGGI